MIADIILKVAEDEAKEEGEHNYSERPSLAGPERCLRQMVYWGLKYPRKPLPGRAVVIFDDSSWHEELTGDWLRKTSYKLHSQQMEVEISPTMKGHIDGILTDLSGKDILLEHKAINHFTFGMYEKGKIFPIDYITQTCLYLLGLNKIQPELIDALLLIKNKNTSQYFEYYISYDVKNDIAKIEYMMSSTDCVKIKPDKTFENLTQNCFDKFAEVNRCIKNNFIPPRQYERSDWQCNYCPYGELCWGGWENEIEQMESDAILDEEMETIANYYLETNLHLKEMAKEKEELKKKIKDRMKELKVKEGIAGKYIVKLSVREKKEFISPASKFEMLSVYLKKGG